MGCWVSLVSRHAAAAAAADKTTGPNEALAKFPFFLFSFCEYHAKNRMYKI